MSTIAEAWENFVRICIPSDAHEGQIEDMKSAFYGGAATCFGIVIREAINQREREVVKAKLEAIDQELVTFAVQLGPQSAEELS